MRAVQLGWRLAMDGTPVLIASAGVRRPGGERISYLYEDISRCQLLNGVYLYVCLLRFLSGVQLL